MMGWMGLSRVKRAADRAVLKEQITLLEARVTTQQAMLELEARRRLELEAQLTALSAAQN